MIVELSGPVAIGAAGVIGALLANALAVVRAWHRVDLRLTLIESRMHHIERNTSRGEQCDGDD